MMSEILKMFQLVDQDRMAEMQIRRRRIESRLDAQGPAFFEARVNLDSNSAC